jgi:hypothetical protein
MTIVNCLRQIVAGLIIMFLTCGSAWSGPEEGLLDNPTPAAPLNTYATYELRPLTLMKPYAGQGANEKAAAKIREHIDAHLVPILTAWSTAGTAAGKSGTLVVEPVIEQIKFIGGATRFWAGAMAGSSYVVMRLKISDSASGNVIAEPEFFQRAAAMSGAWTVGGQDNDMLQRIVTVATAYLTANYESAVGGPTGRATK